MGPDLSQLPRETTAADLVDSILRPSKKINDEYAQVVVVTLDGKTTSGLRIAETEAEIVLRDTSDISLMPKHLATQLKDRDQFFDLVEYLMQQRR